MKLRKPEPCLAILAALLLGRFVFEVIPYKQTNQRIRSVHLSPVLGAEHLLAQQRCVSSHLLADPRTAHIFPIVSPQLSELFLKQARSHPFKDQSAEEVQTALEYVHGIGPKKSARLVSYLCTDEEG
jgi:hypothetical protein